jgi:hypothetical protein
MSMSWKAWSSVRHALELRHRSWFTDEIADIMRANNIAVCMGDAPDFPMWRAVTSDLVYVRLHGHTRKYASSYSEASLRSWAADTKRWLAEGRDVHVYFDNDAEGHAVRNALRFQELVVGTPPREIPATARAMPSPERKPYPSPWRSINSPRRPAAPLRGPAKRDLSISKPRRGGSVRAARRAATR